uniref:Ig-like domain-containing protein n=1 Tax=Salmo trutta TaxID=8032 RepID=A0A674BDJ9_SALTR
MSTLTVQYVVYNMFKERIVIHSYLTTHIASHSECVFEGEGVTLSCNYTGSYSSDTLQWYRQYPRSKPEFLLYITPEGSIFKATPPPPRLTVSIDKVDKRVDLKISSAEVTDSSLYYCAMKTTVTENSDTLYKNLSRTMGGNRHPV